MITVSEYQEKLLWINKQTVNGINNHINIKTCTLVTLSYNVK